MKRLSKLFTNNEKYGKISIGKSNLTGNNIWFADIEDFLSSNNEWKKLLDENQYERVLIKNDKDIANDYAIGYIGEALKPINIFAIEIFEFREIETNTYVSIAVICEIEKKDGDYKANQTSFNDLQFYVYDNTRSEQLTNQNQINGINIYKKITTKEQFFDILDAINEGL